MDKGETTGENGSTIVVKAKQQERMEVRQWIKAKQQWKMEVQ